MTNYDEATTRGDRYQRLGVESSTEQLPGTMSPLSDTLDEHPPAFSLEDEENTRAQGSRTNDGRRYGQLPAEAPPTYPADDEENAGVVIDPSIMQPNIGLPPNRDSNQLPRTAVVRGKSIQRAITSFFKSKTRPTHNRLATDNPDELSANAGATSLTDGVFSNLSAKPDNKPEGAAPDGSDMPPDYSEIAEDVVPPYLDLTGSGLASLVGATETEDGEIYIHGYPIGSSTSFFISMLVSMSFHFVGFLLTYFLSTSHAGKNGSRAGFGVTLIQFGLYFRQRAIHGVVPHEEDPSDNDSSSILDHHASAHSTLEAPPPPSGHSIFHHAHSHFTHSAAAFITADWFAYILMLTGWFLIIRSISDFIRAKRMERLIKAGVEGAVDNPAVEIRQAESYV